MVGHGGSSAGSYLADPTFPIPSHCASIVVTSTVRVNKYIAFLAAILSNKYKYATKVNVMQQVVRFCEVTAQYGHRSQCSSLQCSLYQEARVVMTWISKLYRGDQPPVIQLQNNNLRLYFFTIAQPMLLK